MKPELRPANPCFSSGPTSKRPGWSISNLSTESLGRSHRASNEKGKLREIIEMSKSILGIPDDYLLGIVPGSDTGAFEMAMWNLLGQRGIDVLSWESFSQGWRTDIQKHLKLDDVRDISAEYGDLPDLNTVDSSRDVVFAWNGTTSGVRVPDADWIAADRTGLTLCDATSAVFAMDLDWSKLDVVTWSWQKVMGGEAAHGMIALSPRAVERLESYTPDWPLPKLFRLTKGGKLIRDIFRGATINTPSMIAVEDQLDGLTWATRIGGLTALIDRSERNLAVTVSWVGKSSWAEFLAREENTRSSTSICLRIKDPWFIQKKADEQSTIVKAMVNLLGDEGVAYDIGSYRDAPAGIRIWGGGTIEDSDIEKLLPWLDWAFDTVKNAN
ncbi:MAG TPA: phosphoserine transaminase [Gammaproteobacteria bacterium]|nr:phosphoserine transaminase [Gammaproteobacteria bacterium]HIL95223.1 phosphoserine transaminase [Pseudomonadales bacterium]